MLALSNKEVIVVFGKREFMGIMRLVTPLQSTEGWMGGEEVNRGSSFG